MRKIFGKNVGNNLIYSCGLVLAVARALAARPQVLILDEPTSALDAIRQQKLLDDMLPLLKDKTVLLISHDTRVINYYADEMTMLHNQQLVLTV